MAQASNVQVFKAELPADLPGPRPSELFEDACQEFRRLAARTENFVGSARQSYFRQASKEVGPTLTEETQRFLATIYPKLVHFADQGARPAKRSEIAKHLAILVGCMAGQKVDMAVYSEMLVDDVGALQPCIYAVEAGCRHLRRSSTYVPTIAEVIAAVAKAGSGLREVVELLPRFPALVESIPVAIETGKENARRMEAEEERERLERLEARVRRKAEIRRRIEEDKNISMCERYLVDEVLAEMSIEAAAGTQSPLGSSAF